MAFLFAGVSLAVTLAGIGLLATSDRGSRRRNTVWACYAVGEVFDTVSWLLAGNWVQAGVAAAIAAGCLWLWWRGRPPRRRRRALRAVGERTWALLAGMTRRVRDATARRPVPQPVLRDAGVAVFGGDGELFPHPFV